jgi:hypothetical protein
LLGASQLGPSLALGFFFWEGAAPVRALDAPRRRAAR